MFYEHFVLRKSEPLALVWRLVFDERWKPSRRVILEVNVPKVCELILTKIPNGGRGDVKYSLYLLAQLAYGLTLVVKKRGEFLCNDIESFLPLIRPSSFQSLRAEEQSSAKGKKRRKTNVAAEEVNEQLCTALGAYTLREELPLPEVDIMYSDDFGPVTPAQARQMEHFLGLGNVRAVESKSSSSGSKEYITVAEVAPEVVTGDADKAAHQKEGPEMMEISEDKELHPERQYDLESDEALREHEAKRPPFLSALELSEVHDAEVPAPKKKRRQRGVIIDEVTMFTKAQLHARMENYADLLHACDEPASHISKAGTVTVQDLLDPRPLTLRGEISSSHLYDWIAAPEYDEPPLQYEEAMRLEPMQAPPARSTRRVSMGMEESSKSPSNASIRSGLQDLVREQQIITPVSEEIEGVRRNTTSTAPFVSSTDRTPSQLRSDVAIPLLFGENHEVMKISVATIFDSIVDAGVSRRLTDSSNPPAEKARFTKLFSNLTFESELRGTRLESSGENFLIDAEYPGHQIQQDGQQGEVIQKISVMQDSMQLKLQACQRSSIEETGDTSVPVYRLNQKAEDLLASIVEFTNSHNVTSMNFSELVRDRSRVSVAKTFSNVLELLRNQKITVEQKQNFGEIVISLI